MKRKLEITKQKTSVKRQRYNKPGKMRNIFGSYSKIKNTFKNSDSTILDTVPTDIKDIIAAKTLFRDTITEKKFSYDKEWWYCDNKLQQDNLYTYGVSFSPNNELVITKGKTIKIISLDTYKTVKTIKTDGTPYSVQFSNNGKLLAYGLNNGTVKIINPDTHEEKFYFKTKNPVWALSFNSNDELLGIGQSTRRKSGQIKVADLTKNNITHSLNMPKYVYGIILHDDQKSLTCSLRNGTINKINFNELTDH